MSYYVPGIKVEPLPKTGAREAFTISVAGAGNQVDRFPLNITYTALGIWQSEAAPAAEQIAHVLVQSHGTASRFPEAGFWFDSYNSADSVEETCNLIRNRGSNEFLHPAAQISLGADLFSTLEEIDVTLLESYGHTFLKSLDVLFEPARALEDLNSPATDHPHFIYRICILSGIIDRLDFDDGQGSLNGFERWLAELFGPATAEDLIATYRMVKRLRRQYPIHEDFTVDLDGERRRRRDVVEAEAYFELSGNTEADWTSVFRRFREDTRRLLDQL